MNSFVVPATTYEAQNAYRRLQLTMEKDDPRMAILEIRTFLKIYPDLALACNDLGVLYARTGEKLLALACYEKANRLQPGTPVIVKNLAEFYFAEIGWTDDAILMLTELLQSHPEDVELLNLLGTISTKIGRDQEARTFFSRVLELEPGNRDASLALRQLEGSVPAAEFRPQPARPAVPPAPPVPAPPVQPMAPPVAAAAPAGSSLDDILARLRSTVATSAPTAQPAPPVQPAPGMSADQRYREAQDAVANGDAERALALLEQLVAETPVYPLAHNDLGILYTNAGRLDLACNHHELAMQQAPDNPLFAKNLAALYYALCGRTDEAIAIYTRLVREYPTDVEVLTALAIISNNNNLKEQARTFISRVLDFEPWNTEARRFLAEL